LRADLQGHERRVSSVCLSADARLALSVALSADARWALASTYDRHLLSWELTWV
jgi:hypothetical protein